MYVCMYVCMYTYIYIYRLPAQEVSKVSSGWPRMPHSRRTMDLYYITLHYITLHYITL